MVEGIGRSDHFSSFAAQESLAAKGCQMVKLVAHLTRCGEWMLAAKDFRLARTTFL
ncbi:hypothetical protein [Streptomyces echinatus]|uniref:hypothetical protein n=1 Tax=Streptomyces echinatus TaxID=67293 RepID=UPI00381B1FF0